MNQQWTRMLMMARLAQTERRNKQMVEQVKEGERKKRKEGVERERKRIDE